MEVEINIPTEGQVLAVKDDERGLRTMLDSLSRLELIAFEDAYMHLSGGKLWETFYTVVYTAWNWPLKREQFNELLDDEAGFWGTKKTVDELKKQLDGIQKKVDRISKLLENVQITASAKSILDL